MMDCFFYSRMTRYFSCKESYTPQFQKEKQICHCHPFLFVWRRQMSQHCSHAEHLIDEFWSKLLLDPMEMISCFHASASRYKFLLPQLGSKLLNTLPWASTKYPIRKPLASFRGLNRVQSQKRFPSNWWPGSPSIQLQVLVIHVNPMSTPSLSGWILNHSQIIHKSFILNQSKSSIKFF